MKVMQLTRFVGFLRGCPDPKYTQLIDKLREATSSFDYDQLRTPLEAKH